MWKRLMCFLTLALCCAAPHVEAQETASPGGQAGGMVVIDADTGRVLMEKDSTRRLPMASTTKIMSALLTLEQPDLDVPFTVDAKAIRVEGSSMGLREGDTVTLRALAYGMLLPSGNDAANAAAVRIAGTKEAFVAMMNERAEEIGLADTHFVTPSGLDSEDHYSSARDMALLAREALSNEAFAEICCLKSARVSFGNPPYDRWMTNHNKLLKYYPGAYGVKTGFTERAGRCLVSAAEKNDVRLVVVTLHCPDDWNVHMKLYDTCFAKARRETVPLPEISLPAAGAGSIPCQWDRDAITLLEGETMETAITAQPFLFAPVSQGRIVGKAVVKVNGTAITEFHLAAAQDIALPEPEPSWLERLVSWINRKKP